MAAGTFAHIYKYVQTRHMIMNVYLYIRLNSTRIGWRHACLASQFRFHRPLSSLFWLISKSAFASLVSLCLTLIFGPNSRSKRRVFATSEVTCLAQHWHSIGISTERTAVPIRSYPFLALMVAARGALLSNARSPKC